MYSDNLAIVFYESILTYYIYFLDASTKVLFVNYDKIRAFEIDALYFGF